MFNRVTTVDLAISDPYHYFYEQGRSLLDDTTKKTSQVLA